MKPEELPSFLNYGERDRDFPDDRKRDPENGSYNNQCFKCRNTFVGHKHRVICAVCEKENAERLARLTDRHTEGPDISGRITEFARKGNKSAVVEFQDNSTPIEDFFKSIPSISRLHVIRTGSQQES